MGTLTCMWRQNTKTDAPDGKRMWDPQAKAQAQAHGLTVKSEQNDIIFYLTRNQHCI